MSSPFKKYRKNSCTDQDEILHLAVMSLVSPGPGNTNVLQLCLRYQDHLRQLSEAVAFDQNALCIRIKEIDHTIQVLMNALVERQKKYSKYVEQFGRVSETLITLKKIQKSMTDIVPKMDMLNRLLPASEQLEPFSTKAERSSSK